VEGRWISTKELERDAGAVLDPFHGHWCVPGSPYASLEGALAGIADSRRQGRPFLGTCGGFQHAALEYARHVVGIADAQHAEVAPEGGTQVITPLECSLLETMGHVIFAPGTKIAQAYGRFHTAEGYHCRYGVNPEFRNALVKGGMTVAGVDELGATRALEIATHPFFVAVLFQPERSALAAPRAHPLIAAFVEAARQRAAGPLEVEAAMSA
jgi:CTP synthase (UTP-ammonia lyase)